MVLMIGWQFSSYESPCCGLYIQLQLKLAVQLLVTILLLSQTQYNALFLYYIILKNFFYHYHRDKHWFILLDNYCIPS